MQLFVTIFHISLCILLILIILLQPGKGGDIASAFGGGGGIQMYGNRAQGNLLGRATTAVAVCFMVTSITLAIYSSERLQSGSSGIEDEILRLEQQTDPSDATTSSASGEAEPVKDAEATEADGASSELPAEELAPSEEAKPSADGTEAEGIK